MTLETLWLCAIILLWIGFLLLEGFDLGVGMHMVVSAHTTNERRLMLNTIGPVWDGNEVWLVTAIAAMFAAFPAWYASLLAGLYLPLVVVLVALIARAVGIEYRAKGASPRWVRFWESAIGVGSFVVAFGIGVLLGATTTGLPLDAHGDRVGGAFAWLTLPALLGGVAVVGFCLVHGATYLGLKTHGPVRQRVSAFTTRFGVVMLAPGLAWVTLVQLRGATALSLALASAALVAVVLVGLNAQRHHEGRAFVFGALFVVLMMAAIFAAQFPVLLPSTLSPLNDITVSGAASAPYTLGVMSVVALVGLPLVLLYQGYSYWVFRARLREGQLPHAHIVRPAVRLPQ